MPKQSKKIISDEEEQLLQELAEILVEAALWHAKEKKDDDVVE